MLPHQCLVAFLGRVGCFFDKSSEVCICKGTWRYTSVDHVAPGRGIPEEAALLSKGRDDGQIGVECAGGTD